MKVKYSIIIINKILKFKAKDLSKITLNKFEVFIINNTYIEIIIKFITKLNYNAKSRYNFRN